MGTRGKFGFFYKGRYYISYNHFDSYPSYLGVRLILEILDADLDKWIKLLEKIKLVSDDVKPRPEDIERLEKYTDLTISSCSTDDWDCLLYHTQGSFYHVLHCGYLENVHGVDMEEEYFYILDLDNRVLRVEDHEEEEFDATIALDREELMKYMKEWSEKSN